MQSLVPSQIKECHEDVEFVLIGAGRYRSTYQEQKYTLKQISLY